MDEITQEFLIESNELLARTGPARSNPLRSRHRSETRRKPCWP